MKGSKVGPLERGKSAFDMTLPVTKRTWSVVRGGGHLVLHSARRASRIGAMELPGNTRIDDDRCFFLLWKGIFIDSWDPDHIPSGDGSFWCNKTQNCLGPDSREVGDYECNETRRCYKAM